VTQGLVRVTQGLDMTRHVTQGLVASCDTRHKAM
jgi:hypothetical protein